MRRNAFGFWRWTGCDFASSAPEAQFVADIGKAGCVRRRRCGMVPDENVVIATPKRCAGTCADKRVAVGTPGIHPSIETNKYIFRKEIALVNRFQSLNQCWAHAISNGLQPVPIRFAQRLSRCWENQSANHRSQHQSHVRTLCIIGCLILVFTGSPPALAQQSPPPIPMPQDTLQRISVYLQEGGSHNEGYALNRAITDAIQVATLARERDALTKERDALKADAAAKATPSEAPKAP